MRVIVGIALALGCAHAADIELRTDPWLREAIPFQLSVHLPDTAPWLSATLVERLSPTATRALASTLVGGDIQPGWLRLTLTCEQVRVPEVELRIVAGRMTATAAIATPLSLRALPMTSSPRAVTPLTRWIDTARSDLDRLPPTVAVLNLTQRVMHGDGPGWDILGHEHGLIGVRRHGALDKPQVLLLRANDGRASAAAWPEVEAEIRVAAEAAGVTWNEIHPGGDTRGDGWLCEAAAIYLRAHPGTGVIDGTGGIAAAALQERHAQAAAWIRVADGQRRDDWSAPASAPSASATAAALPDALRRPAIIIYGSGEHDAQRERDQRTAMALAAAWTAHTVAAPQVVRDQDFISNPSDARTWILIGTPMSNAVLATRAQHLPWTWDHRSVGPLLVNGSATAARQHRSEAFALHARMRDPLRADAWLIVLDGSAPWTADATWRSGDWPLRGLGETVLKPSGSRARSVP